MSIRPNALDVNELTQIGPLPLISLAYRLVKFKNIYDKFE
ncbi:putative uncharacterized protein [Parachlamydia acanthamoebae UV-7]|uniref:Uncharacterized protein n=1 Tax=Parachlamydia acanthamoebae (strain UV7) TaxID=765952 RepID=F8KWA4_PARAV|nr:hypothetical protein pah_c050o042 [Parachlamydia acanthamoebae str. Hall's coccus]CCB86046.1 putative uncharacterized protein [Parachlamydia acanthamoebae UV-7]